MAATVDARGFSCPQPVIMTLDEIEKGKEKELGHHMSRLKEKESFYEGWQK